MKTLSRSQPNTQTPPVAAATKPKAKRRAQVAEHTLTDKEHRKLFRTIKGHRCPLAQRDYHLFRFIALQGPRVGSVARMTCGDVRQWLAESEMHIRDAIAKAGKGYTAPLRAEAGRELQALVKLRRQYPEDPLPTDDDALFLWGQRGAGMSDRTIQQRMQKWRKVAGITVKVTPHWLRHGLAYELRGNTTHQNKEAVVGAMLGQSAAAVSAQYGQPSRQELIDAIPKAKH